MNHAAARRRLFFSIIVQLSLTVLILHCPTLPFQTLFVSRPAAARCAGCCASALAGSPSTFSPAAPCLTFLRLWRFLLPVQIAPTCVFGASPLC
jgi:hypothetical protein